MVTKMVSLEEISKAKGLEWEEEGRGPSTYARLERGSTKLRELILSLNKLLLSTDTSLAPVPVVCDCCNPDQYLGK